MSNRLKFMLFLAARPVLRAVYRQQRGMTLGTRTVVLRGDPAEVLLVRHAYAPGWMLPGGGVERGESLEQSARRELAEEAGIIAEGPLQMHGMFLNDAQFRGDHVACFVLRRFREAGFVPNTEIAEARFFPVASLPEATSPGTRRRIAEILDGAAPPPAW